jgi:hypothetical protein
MASRLLLALSAALLPLAPAAHPQQPRPPLLPPLPLKARPPEAGWGCYISAPPAPPGARTTCAGLPIPALSWSGMGWTR